MPTILSAFAFQFSFRGATLAADPQGNESLHDAMLRAISDSAGQAVKTCSSPRRIEGGAYRYTVVLADGQSAEATIAAGSTAQRAGQFS